MLASGISSEVNPFVLHPGARRADIDFVADLTVGLKCTTMVCHLPAVGPCAYLLST